MKAFLTGGSGDIGFAIANYFLDHQYDTTIIDKKINRLQGVTQQCKADQIDLVNSENVQTYLNTLQNPIDVMVYAAGCREIRPITELSLDEWQEIQNVNLTGAFLTSKHFIKLALMHHHPLCIIYISSISGLAGEPERGSYCASKHGLIGLTKSLAIELASRQIRVNAIAPGVIDTDLTRPYKSSPEIMQNLKRNIPFEKWGDPEHIVQSIDFIIKNNYVTGSTLVVDGGWMAGKIL